MHVLYLDWPCFKGEDLCFSLKNHFGFDVIRFSHEDYTERNSEGFLQTFRELIKKQPIDFCISYNFFPLLARAAHEHNIKYISLVYDNPFVKLYSYTITYPTNYVFIFDYNLYEKLRLGGISTVYYSTLPVNADNISVLLDEPYDKEKLTAEVSFVGSLYNEDHNIFDRMYGKLDDYTKGYVDSIMQAQLKISGYYFIEELLPQPIIDKLYEAEPYQNSSDGAETLANIYADYYFGRKLTSMERIDLLSKVAAKHPLSLFTKDPTAIIPGANNFGPIDYYMEMPIVFHESKINLNITLRSIQSGIPLRCMDIMGCGGFLLTNFQADFLRHFTPDEDYVYFEDEDDLLQKIDYYLNHDDKRRAIAESGFEKVRMEHGFIPILGNLFSIAGI
ncbi:MAG: glycosyltransferase [bacterium]|nr:glycosyltransferase [bacterium]